jgi:hypothetical protein
MSGARPLAGIRLRVDGAAQTTDDVASGADGSFNVPVYDSTDFFMVQAAPGSLYFTPCPAFAWNGQAKRVELDVHVVSGAILSTVGMPPSYPTESPIGGYRALISGRVVERTSGGLEPVSGATVSLDSDTGDTLTDANGRYLLCSVGNSEVGVTVSARKLGYTTASAFGIPWFGWDLDFELMRRSESTAAMPDHHDCRRQL